MPPRLHAEMKLNGLYTHLNIEPSRSSMSCELQQLCVLDRGADCVWSRVLLLEAPAGAITGAPKPAVSQ